MNENNNRSGLPDNAKIQAPPAGKKLEYPFSKPNKNRPAVIVSESWDEFRKKERRATE